MREETRKEERQKKNENKKTYISSKIPKMEKQKERIQTQVIEPSIGILNHIVEKHVFRVIPTKIFYIRTTKSLQILNSCI